MRGRLQDVVGASQLRVLPLEPLQLRQLVARSPRPAAPIPLGLADPQANRLGLGPELLSHRANRLPLRPVLAPVVEHHPHGPLTQLARVLPLPWHHSILLKGWSLHRTRGGSLREFLELWTRTGPPPRAGQIKRRRDAQLYRARLRGGSQARHCDEDR